MRLKIAKWGNSLAIRLPTAATRAAGLKEGDSVEASIAPTGAITLVPAVTFDKAAFLRRVAKLQALMPASKPVVEQMRKDARY